MLSSYDFNTNNVFTYSCYRQPPISLNTPNQELTLTF